MGFKTNKTRRQSRVVDLPDEPTLTLRVENVREPAILDRMLDLEDQMRGQFPKNTPLRIYQGNGIRVIITRSRHAEFGSLLQASVSIGKNALPPWPVMIAIKRAIFPDDVCAMMPMPEETNYVNLAQALHIIQCPGPWGNL